MNFNSVYTTLILFFFYFHNHYLKNEHAVGHFLYFCGQGHLPLLQTTCKPYWTLELSPNYLLNNDNKILLAKTFINTFLW